jgi:hypothetical protein
MTPTQLISRARTAAGKSVIYKLGQGGMNPVKAMPTNAKNQCDCSGFVCWALGISRQTDHPLFKNFNGGWINTNAMVFDATQSTGFFRPATLMVPGVILVYPGGKLHKVGHCGIVTKLGPGGLPSTVIHCSSGNSKKGDAIQETSPAIFQTADTVAIWYEGLIQSAAMASHQPKFG